MLVAKRREPSHHREAFTFTPGVLYVRAETRLSGGHAAIIQYEDCRGPWHVHEVARLDRDGAHALARGEEDRGVEGLHRRQWRGSQGTVTFTHTRLDDVRLEALIAALADRGDLDAWLERVLALEDLAEEERGRIATHANRFVAPTSWVA